MQQTKDFQEITAMKNETRIKELENITGGKLCDDQVHDVTQAQVYTSAILSI